MSLVIPTERLELRLQSPAEVLAYIESLPATVRTEVSPEWLARVRETSEGDPWSLGFQIFDQSSRGFVGSCAFKGPPDAEGMVEVAYGIDTAFRGRGFATEANAALVNFAFASGQVKVVRAHTKPNNGPSVAVLTKCGFQNLGEVVDPEDGLVWRWMRTSPVVIAAARS